MIEEEKTGKLLVTKTTFLVERYMCFSRANLIVSRYVL